MRSLHSHSYYQKRAPPHAPRGKHHFYDHVLKSGRESQICMPTGKRNLHKRISKEESTSKAEVLVPTISIKVKFAPKIFKGIETPISKISIGGNATTIDQKSSITRDLRELLNKKE